MDDFYRAPILQVRDARAVSNRSDVEALKNFFDNPPPLEPEANPRHSLSKSTDSRKQGKRKFFSLGKKRLSASDLEAEPYTYGLSKSSSQPIPAGTTQRTVHGSTVIMIGSPLPPLAKHRNFQTPKLEITPASPIMLSSPPLPTLQPHSTSSPDSAVVRMNAWSVNRPGTLIGDSSMHSALAKVPSDVLMMKSVLPKLVASVSESEHRLIATLDGQHAAPVSSVPFTGSILSSSSDLYCPPSVPQDGLGQDHVDAVHASVEGGVARQEATHTSARMILQSVMPVEHDHRDIIITKEAPSQAVSDGFMTQVVEKENTNRCAKFQSPSGSEDTARPCTVPFNPKMPPTPSSSSSSIPALQKEASVTSIQSTISLKKRSKKHKVTSVSHRTSMPDPNQLHLEIIDLEAMDDKERAFNELSGLYKQQKYLREAEQTHHQQEIADLTARFIAQEMQIRQLVQLLQLKGVSDPEMQSIMSALGDRPSLSRGGSADSAASVDNPNLDPSRFALLRKEEQFGRMWQFSSTQEPFATLESDSHEEEPPNDTAASLVLVKRPKASVHRPPLTPAPSMPLPPVPRSRRNSHSMFIFNSAPLVGPISRSRSLTEANVSPIPHIDSFTLEQKMRELERDFGVFFNGRRNASTQSVDSGSNSEDILEFYEALGDEDFSPPTTAKNPQFILDDQDVEEEADANEITIESVPATESLSHSGSYISPILGPSPSTFHTPEVTNDLDNDWAFPADLATVTHNSGVTNFDHDALIEHARTRHTMFENVPHVETSVTYPSSRPTSIDDHTWGTLFMGIMSRPDIEQSVTGDPIESLEA